MGGILSKKSIMRKKSKLHQTMIPIEPSAPTMDVLIRNDGFDIWFFEMFKQDRYLFEKFQLNPVQLLFLYELWKLTLSSERYHELFGCHQDLNNHK